MLGDDIIPKWPKQDGKVDWKCQVDPCLELEGSTGFVKISTNYLSHQSRFLTIKIT